MLPEPICRKFAERFTGLDETAFFGGKLFSDWPTRQMGEPRKFTADLIDQPVAGYDPSGG